MRIVAGRWRGRRLQTFEGSAIRPTSDRARETLFNILGPSIEDASFLDLFAGTGAVGLEAMSRSCGEVVFVDSSALAAKVIRSNLEIRGAGKSASPDQSCPYVLLKQEAVPAIKELARQKREFDFIFIDPPYADGHYAPVMETLRRFPILKAGGWIIVEHASRRGPEFSEFGWTPFRVVKVGDTSFSFFEGENLK